MTLAPFVATLGRGPGRSRSLTQSEATQAMTLMLSGDAAPEAVGAILMLMRMKGEVAEEIAGFATAARAVAPDLPDVELDWPSYAAGRTRGLPWFLLAAKLVAQSGRRVLVHGWNGNDTAVRDGIAALGIPFADAASEVGAAMQRHSIAYLPLETYHPPLFSLLNLRATLGLRSCINTICRMLNPAGAPAAVQGVFHPSYRLLQADAAACLGLKELSVVKGGGGEFECNPAKDLAVFGRRNGAAWEAQWPATWPAARRLSEPGGATADLCRVWDGTLRDPFAEAIILSTTALALGTCGAADPQAEAADLWHHRHRACAA